MAGIGRNLTVIAALSLALTANAEGLPDLGEPKSRSIYPAIGIAIAAVVVDQAIPGCDYPCNHYTHIAGGAVLAAAVSHYYGEPAAWGVGIAYSFGTEIYGKYAKDKEFRMKDVAGRAIGTGLGIWLYRSF